MYGSCMNVRCVYVTCMHVLSVNDKYCLVSVCVMCVSGVVSICVVIGLYVMGSVSMVYICVVCALCNLCTRCMRVCVCVRV